MNVQEDVKEVINDYLSMLENGTSNDVTILLEDGEMKANKDVLIARSSYFSSMRESIWCHQLELRQESCHARNHLLLVYWTNRFQDFHHRTTCGNDDPHKNDVNRQTFSWH